MVAVTGVLDPVDTDMRTPAFIVNNPQNTNLNSDPLAGLSFYTNPVEGNVDTGVTHEGDLGGAA
jgi:hypothetical protein